MVARLSAAARPNVLDRLAERSYDVLVVGGGVTGAGIALDAASRGLSVALVERDDLASGTSSKSSKLVHGGLRYLEHGDLALVRESSVERDLLRRLAPHLVRPQPFLVPRPGGAEGLMLSTAMYAYDVLAGFGKIGRHRRVSSPSLLERVPGLARHLDRGAYQYADCRTDDARLTLAVARAAADHGADIVTRAEVVGLRTVAGRVTGATVRDRLGDTDIAVSARVTVSATGVWADAVQRLAAEPRLRLVPSKGVHLVFDVADLQVATAVIIPSAAHDGRRVFCIPWGGQVMVGTTDGLFSGSVDAPDVDAADAAYCCDAVNAAFGADLTAADAIGAWAGLRPLLAARESGDEPAAPTDTLSRRHALVESPPGLLTVTGGKLTTYRRMAADAVDTVASSLGVSGSRCITDGITLGLRGSFEAAVARTATVCDAFGVDAAVAEGLVERHGDEAAAVVQAAADRGEQERLVEGLPYLRVEAWWAVEHELALEVDDVLQRRLRVSVRDAAAGGSAIDDVARLLAGALGWNAARRKESVRRYVDAVATERGVVPVAATGAGRVRS